MNSVPPWRCQAVVTLSNLDQRTPCALPERKIYLTRDFATIQIGRTSKRNSSLEALVTNCWFDSAVMSRDHAQLRFDSKDQKVYVSDVGSLHGTFLNEHALVPHESQELREGDILRFGIPIERGRDVYNPIAMEVAISHGMVRLNDQPTIFRVPDDTDVEDLSGDEESAVQHSTKLLQQHEIRPAHPHSSSNAVSIDLTGNDTNSGPAATIVNLEETLSANNVLSQDLMDSNYPSHIDLTSQDDDNSSHETEGIPDHVPQQHDDNVVSDTKDESHPNVTAFFDESDDADYDVDDGSDSELESLSEAHSSTSDSDMLEGLSPSFEDGSSPLFVPDEEFEDHSSMDDEDVTHLEHETLLGDNHENGLTMSKDDGADLEPKSLAPPQITGNSEIPSPLVKNQTTESEFLPTIQPQRLWTSPPLPSMMMEGGGKLPNLSQMYNSFPHAGLANVRLPSIYQTVSTTPNFQSPADSRSTAEIMGEKTGKYEYFYARADNSILKSIERPPVDEEQASTSQISSMAVISEPVQSQQIPTFSAPSIDSTEQHNPWCQEPRTMTAADTPGPWSSSGNQFLASPLPPQGGEEVQVSQNVLLDDTSAYQYEVSKKVANASGPCVKSKEGLMTINNLVDPPSDRVKSPEPSSAAHKRKIDEISTLTAAENPREADVERMGSTHPVNSSITVDHSTFAFQPLQMDAQGLDPHQVDFLRSGLPRPVKRLRRVAEVVGIAAIGGAFVMSALIATAPAF